LELAERLCGGGERDACGMGGGKGSERVGQVVQAGDGEVERVGGAVGVDLGGEAGGGLGDMGGGDVRGRV